MIELSQDIEWLRIPKDRMESLTMEWAPMN